MSETHRPILTPAVEAAIKNLNKNESVRNALAQAVEQQELRVKEQCDLTLVPSPPFGEEKRADYFAKLLVDAGLDNVHKDAIGNVIGRHKGTGDGPVLVIGAHLDTVFPAGTPIALKQEGTVYYAPGISDDAAGLASLLQVVRSIKDNGIRTIGDIVFVGTLGEEGNGDLRGSKALWNAPNDYDGMLAIDSANPRRITRGGVGSKRYRITFRSAGGHSLHHFGLVGSAIHAMARAIYKLDNIEAPTDPKCTFNVGVVKGGTSVNAIASEASLELDVRSFEQDSLVKFVAQILPLFGEAVEEENARWKLDDKGKVSVEIETIGDRPAGTSPDDSPVIQAAFGSLKALGLELEKYTFAATDQNVPLARGIPATTLGAGGVENFNHSVAEWWDAKDAFIGPQLAILTALALVGVKGVSDAVLPKRQR